MLGVVVGVRVDNRIVGLIIGDWHLVPLGEDIGELIEQLEVEGQLVWKLEVQVPVSGPPGLLSRRIRPGVLVVVDVGFSLCVSNGDESFGTCTRGIIFLLKCE